MLSLCSGHLLSGEQGEEQPIPCAVTSFPAPMPQQDPADEASAWEPAGLGEGSTFLPAQQDFPLFPPLLNCSLRCFHTLIFPFVPPQKDLNPVYKSPPLCSAISHLCSPLSCPSLEVLLPAQPPNILPITGDPFWDAQMS